MNKLVFYSLAALLAASNPVLASSTVTEQIAKESMEIVFTETERAVIREFFGHSANKDPESVANVEGGGKKDKKDKKGKKDSKGMPAGLAKRDALPPGLQRQLDKNGALPPGLQKKALPSDLQSRLPPAPKGYERVIVDADVLLIETATGVVRDVVRDVIRGVLN